MEDNCSLHSYMESLLFAEDAAQDDMIDDLCAICLGKITERPDLPACCGNYGKRLKSCSHWFHVACQLRTEQQYRCPICRRDVISAKKFRYMVEDYEASLAYNLELCPGLYLLLTYICCTIIKKIMQKFF
jgi:hypothetical protein